MYKTIKKGVKEMPRPSLDVVKVTITINKKDLFEAQLAAGRKGVDPDIVKNNSAFIRWLINNYKTRNLK